MLSASRRTDPTVMLSPSRRTDLTVMLSPSRRTDLTVMLSPSVRTGGEASAGLAVLLAAALLALPAAAQSSEGTTKKGSFRAGPFWLTPRVVLYNAGSDSNVYNDEVAPVASGSGSLRPSLDVLLPVGRKLDLKTNGWLGWSWFKDQDGQGSVDRGLGAGAELRLGPVTLNGSANKGWAHQRFSIEIDERLDRKDETWGGGASVRLGRRFSLGGSVAENRFRYEAGIEVNGDLVSESLDRDGQSLQGQASLVLTNFTTLVLEAGRQEDTFVSDPTLQDAVALSYRYAGGFNFVAGGLFTGHFRVGWRAYPSGQQAAPEASGTLLEASLVTGAGRLGRLTLDGARDIAYAAERVDGQRNSYVSSRYGVRLDTELPASLVARGWLGWQQADYVLPYEQGDQSVDRKDTVRIQGLGLLRAFGKTFSVGGTIEWSRRASDVPGFDYVRRAYGITAEYTP